MFRLVREIFHLLHLPFAIYLIITILFVYLQVFFACLIAIVAAKPKPGFLAPAVYTAPAIYSAPVATSYSYSTAVHAPVVAAPVVGSYVAPVVKSYVSQPLVHSSYVAPAISSYSAYPAYSTYAGGYSW